MRIATLGGGGMIGGALTRRLLDDDHEVRAVDIKPLGEWIVRTDADELQRDMRYLTDAHEAVTGCDRVYLHSASMGGMHFVENNKAECAFNTLITMNVLMACRDVAPDARVFFAGSACCYPAYLQSEAKVVALKESDAYPAQAEEGYGWSKLYDEMLCRYVREDWSVDTRIGRYHNIAATPTTYTEPRAKAPAGLSRKVAEAAFAGRDWIDVWGPDGKAVRSFCWIDDAVEATIQVMESDFVDPINIGSAEAVTIDELIDVIEVIKFGESGVLERRYDPDGARGVEGRSSDNTLFRETFGWQPSTKLADWMPILYEWVEEQVAKSIA